MSAASETKPKRGYTRELTSVIAGPLMIWIVGWAPEWLFIAVFTIVAVLALHEFLEFGRSKGYPIQRTVSIILMLVLLASFVLDDVSVEVGVFATLLAIPALYVFTTRRVEDALPGTAVCIVGVLYIGMLFGAFLRLRTDFAEGSKLIYFLLLVVWMGDAGAYYVGSKFGKRRLSPLISPKKSIEGGIGGMITSLIAAAVISLTFFPEFPLVHAMICGALLSCTGVIGDLAESLWKRSAAVKDSGTLIPGHGGFLDRSDSILFTAPLLYGYWWLLQHQFRLT